MRITELKPGFYATRKWYRTNKNLCIYCSPLGDLYYMQDGNITEKLRTNSSSYKHEDFVLCDREANILKGKVMVVQELDLDKIECMVVSSSGCIRHFESEDEAITAITDILEVNHKEKFILCKPYKKVEIPRKSIMDYVKDIVKP